MHLMIGKEECAKYEAKALFTNPPFGHANECFKTIDKLLIILARGQRYVCYYHFCMLTIRIVYLYIIGTYLLRKQIDSFTSTSIFHSARLQVCSALSLQNIKPPLSPHTLFPEPLTTQNMYMLFPYRRNINKQRPINKVYPRLVPTLYSGPAMT